MNITNACQSIPSLLLIISAVTSYASSSEVAAKPTLPNIVFILADDMSYDSVSALNDKIGEMKTPQIDRLAKEGMIFDDAHSASSVCTPTRYGILTGRYCWRTKLKNTVLWDYAAPLIEDGRLTMGTMLQDKGYRTYMVGKWHLGMGWPGKDGQMVNQGIFKRLGEKQVDEIEKKIDFKGEIKSPRAFGFDYYFGVDVPNFAPYCWIENDHLVGTPTIPKPKSMFGRYGIMQEGWELDRILPTLAEKSVAYINEAAPKDKPYFLYLPLTSPHSPIAPSAAFRGKSGISTYADFVLETDWAVGQVLNAIEASGESDNTLVVFTADNGTSSVCDFEELESHGVNLHNHFRGHKMQIYEGGHRVSLLVKWPKQVKAGRRNGETVCLNDFFATFAEITDHQIQDSQAEDSYSILPLITGESESLPGHPMVVHHSYGGQFSIRNKQWKLILPLKEGETPVLYNLDSDIKETRSVADQHPEVVPELTAALQKYISDGRSTRGEVQQNFNNETSWPGTPGTPLPPETSNGPSNAFDGDVTTRWSSSERDAWIASELAAGSTYDAIDITWYKGVGRKYIFKVEFSLDGTTWDQAFAGVSSGKDISETYVFDQPIEGCHVRITVQGSNVNNWSSIHEVVVRKSED